MEWDFLGSLLISIIKHIMTKTIIIFFLIAIVVAGGWIALVELAGFKTLWAAVLSISVGAVILYLYQRFK